MRVLLPGTMIAKRAGDLQRLLGAGHDVVVVGDGGPELQRAIRDAEVVVAGKLGGDVLRCAARLRLIHCPGAGYEGIELAAVPSGVVVANVFEHESGMAEFVMMQLLALTRDLSRLDRTIRSGDWSMSSVTGADPGPEMGGRTIGIVGYGRIGREVARLARCFRLRVLAATRTARPGDRDSVDTLVGIDRLDWVMAESDYAVVATPLSPETRGLIGARQLRLLGPGGFLINVARGPIVDERALYEALRDRTIAGAAIDTWYRYPSRPDERRPVGDFPFTELDNLLMTPHVAGWTVPTMVRRWEILADNIKRVARGEDPINVVYRAP